MRDLGQFDVRNQMANVPGASVPQPFGGRYRQIMVYVDPLKLEAHQLSVMDVVRTVNDANLILPAGRREDRAVRLQPLRQQPDQRHERHQPAAAEDGRTMRPVLVADVGQAQDASANPVQHRARGRPALGLSAGAEAGRRRQHHRRRGRHQERRVADLLDVPKQLVTKVVFDQSVFVATAIENLIHEGAIGLVLTGADDPGFSRQHAGHGRRSFCPFRFRRWPRSSRCHMGGSTDQRDDSGRSGAGLFAAD